ncbi:MAG TPA: sigma-70 family RNA polymerase sigma factor [Pyrinomonadaceae bacterium]|nr:sigma-70 family RNA polymerase sigma factor [Pyrinomonadaceae bacterium]
MVKSGVTEGATARWKASEASFARFLAWIDAGKDSNGDGYLSLRGRLVSFFERKGCDVPDDLADETLERVNRRLDEAGEIDVETPAKFCYITAKFVFLEYLRSGRRRETSVESADLENFPEITRTNEGEEKEGLSQCLDRCLTSLTSEERELIVEYYFGERRAKIDHRREMAAKLRLTPNALAIRACRIRERLERCIRECSGRMK